MKLVPVSCKHPLSLSFATLATSKLLLAIAFLIVPSPKLNVRMPVTCGIQLLLIQVIVRHFINRVGSEMEIVYQEKEIVILENIQKLKKILRSNLEVTGSMKADLELKF